MTFRCKLVFYDKFYYLGLSFLNLESDENVGYRLLYGYFLTPTVENIIVISPLLGGYGFQNFISAHFISLRYEANGKYTVYG